MPACRISATVCYVLLRRFLSADMARRSFSTPTALLVETAGVLAREGDRAVLGPSSDGGYYLLGLKTAHRRMFEDIAWSTERVAQQTLGRAREIKLDVHMLPVWYDVDDVDGLRRLGCELRRPRASRSPLDSREPNYPAATAE